MFLRHNIPHSCSFFLCHCLLVPSGIWIQTLELSGLYYKHILRIVSDDPS